MHRNRGLNMRFHRHLPALTLALSLLSLPSLSWAENYKDTLITLETQLSQLTSDYAKHNPTTKVKNLDERLAEGVTMQASGDYQRASYIFMDILTQEKWRGLPGYQTAQLELSRSLYENGYYRLSQQYLIELLRNGRGNERTEGVLLLLQVAQKTGDWTEVNAALTDVTDFTQHPSYLYIMGRAMFLQGDNELARKCLSALRTNDEWHVKAQYLLGVLDTIAGDYPAALAQFAAVESSRIEFRKSAQIRELAILAQARLYYEQGMWSEARAAYQKISDKSVYFPTALYEMAWTLLRAEDYAMAQQSFELLLLSYPNDSHALETRRLLADIKRELGQYDEAVTSYQTLVNEFDPIMTKMEAEAKDLNSHKKQLKTYIEAEQYSNVSIVPPQARGIIEVGNDVNSVEQMLNALTASDSNTKDSELLIAEISSALNDDATLRNLPEFQRYANVATDIRLSTLLTAYELTQEYGAPLPDIAPDIDVLKHLPRSSLERDIIVSLQNSARETRQGNQHRIRLQIDNLSHRIQVLRSWINSGKTANMTQNEKEDIEQRIDKLEAKVQTMKENLTLLNSAIAQLRTTYALNSEQRSTAREAMHNVTTALRSQWTHDLQSSPTPVYADLIQKCDSILTELDGFDRVFDDAVKERATELRQKLEREIVLVRAEKERFGTMKSEVGETAGDISLRYWENVYAQVREIVLNADLGMVDIAWLIKDARSKALSATLEERKKEREVLEQDFKQFLKESGSE